ncbi:MAG: hypothetical protein GY820_27785 [Gammaproteobacteria bacterium]|nr:hypothetical protein [Gammaproteobacteria bacterium]
MFIRQIAVTLILVSASVESYSCEFAATRDIAFESLESTNKLVLDLKSKTPGCQEGKLTVQIISKIGETLFETTVYPFGNFFGFKDPDPKYLRKIEPANKKILKGFFEFYLNNAIQNTSNLPDRIPCGAEKTNCDVDYFPDTNVSFWSDLTLEEYNNLKIEAKPMIMIETQNEYWQWFVFDRNTESVEVVLNRAA